LALPVDLLCRSFVVSVGVSWVGILVRDERVLNLGVEVLGNTDVRVRVVEGGLCGSSDNL